MFPFSVTRLPRPATSQQANAAIHEGSGYELISFDAEKLNVFAAEVYYCEPHWHSAPELVCILSGSFSVTLGHTTSVVSAGSMLYIDPDEIHSLEARAPDSKLLTIQFSPHLFDEMHPAPLPGHALIARPDADNAVEREIRSRVIALLEDLVNAQPSFIRMALVYQLLGALAAAGQDQDERPQVSIQKKDQKWVKSAIEYINHHFDEELSLASVAENLGVSYHHFSRIFKKVSGYNFKEFLTMIRINKAKRLLKDTQIPITEISYACGFNGHKPLIFAFNKYCRMTPTAFRKNYLTAMHSTEEQHIMTDFLCLPVDQQVIECLRGSNLKTSINADR